jgi:signal transduction histidine kinase
LAISKHTERIEGYVETMNELQKLEDLLISIRESGTRDLVEQLTSSAEMLGQQAEVKVVVVNRIEAENLHVDIKIILRVMDNLLSNALRYAGERIEIILQIVGRVLTIEVCDDGCGFTEEDLKQASKAFYRNESDDSIHFGLGLYICKVLCEKHGGELLISNQPQGGAIGMAKFHIQK